MNNNELAKTILEQEVLGEKVGLLTTASKRGVPHTTWMASYAFVDHNQIITLTSPDSIKAKNIAKNHHVEWLFTSAGFDHLIYFTGRAYLENDPTQFKSHWKLIPDKSRAYFLETYNSPPGFTMIRTEIDSAILTFPAECRSVELDLPSLL